MKASLYLARPDIIEAICDYVKKKGYLPDGGLINSVPENMSISLSVDKGDAREGESWTATVSYVKPEKQ